jgi:flagellum-specific ATP synthase
MRAMPLLREFLEQGSRERVSMEDTVARLNAMEL